MCEIESKIVVDVVFLSRTPYLLGPPRRHSSLLREGAVWGEYKQGISEKTRVGASKKTRTEKNTHDYVISHDPFRYFVGVSYQTRVDGRQSIRMKNGD